MDYHRIYSDFIKDRRAKEPMLDGYVERHHILPRSMGGSDDPENLVALTPEDHFFAHLLLAKAHNTRGMWGAVMLMLGAKHAGAGKFSIRRKATKWRARYGMIKRKHALLSVGINGANADLAERWFYHFSGKTFFGTRIAFSDEHGVPAHSINQVIRGKATFCGGWSLSREAAASYLREKKRRAVSNGRKLKGYTRASAVYCFVNVETGACVIGTQRGMKELGHLCRTSVSALCTGKSYLRHGWCLIENIEWAEDRANARGKFGGGFTEEAHEFRNVFTGEVVAATIWEMGQLYGNGDSRQFGEVARRRKKGAKGWVLAEHQEYICRRVDLTMHCRTTGETATGNQRFWAAKLGVTQSAISRHARGRANHVKGWFIVEKSWQEADARAA